jgi:hypothetical protein
MNTDSESWTVEAKQYLEGYLQQVQSLLVGETVDAGEIVSDLRDHVLQLATSQDMSLVAVPDVKRLLATVGSPDEVAESWAQLSGGKQDEQDPWEASYLNAPPVVEKQSNARNWIIVGAVAIFLLPFVIHFLWREKPVDTVSSTATGVQVTPAVAVVSQADANAPLVGSWQSVDFVARIEDFQPGAKQWQGGDLYLKGIECFEDGSTSTAFTWDGASLMTGDRKTKAEYVIKTIDGKRYLFLPWLSGDVTIRGQKPKYYVLTPGTFERPEAAPSPAPIPTGAVVAADTGQARKPENLTGVWRSVDFVSEVAEFTPGRQQWAGDLFLKDLECRVDGTTSLGYTWWANGQMAGQEGTTTAEYFVKDLNGETYLFLPWLSGDVTIRGMKPKYYVMKKRQDVPASHDIPGNNTAVGGDITGNWRSVDFVNRVGDFNPQMRSFSGDLFLKDLQCDNGGGTSIGYGWSIDGRMVGQDGRTQATFYTQQINGTAYLYLPWLSGDVTIRGMAPKYYVMRKVR